MLSILRARTTTPLPSLPTTAAEPMARIWLTYKTRIISEKRFKGYALVSHLALTWYAFLSIVFSIFQTNIAKTLGVEGATQASLVIAVLTFGLSLIIYGFKFEEYARVHRDCYLRMQSVYQSNSTDDVKLDEYRKLLEHYPNHSARDYQRFLMAGWKADRVLIGTDGKAIKFDSIDAAKEYLIHTFEILSLVLIFAFPFALITYWISAA
jgi:hypothetical protein